MGAPRRGKMAVHRAWRCRGGHADGIRHRRRSAAAAESRLCGARRFHPWLVRTTHALVHDRAAVGAGCKLQYLPGGAALTHSPPNPDLPPRLSNFSRRERPRRSAPEQRDERAPFHFPTHSITSSARASTDGGTSRPRALAALRLIASSYLVGGLYRQVGRLLTLEDAINVSSGAAVLIEVVGPIA